jgi:hypothetical protein
MQPLLPTSIIYLISEYDFSVQCEMHVVLPISKRNCTTDLLRYCCWYDLVDIFKYATSQKTFTRREIEDAFETAMDCESEEIAFHLYDTVGDLDTDLIYEYVVRCIQKNQAELVYRFLNHRDMDISIEMFYWAILSQNENLIQYLQDCPPCWKVIDD